MKDKLSKSRRRSPIQERSKDLVDSVLLATRDLLLEQGKATTVKIAQAAGVGIGSLYEYFENKEGVYQRLLGSESQRAADFVASKLGALDAENFHEEAPKFIYDLVEHYFDGRKFIEILLEALPYSAVSRLTKTSRFRATDVVVRELNSRGFDFPELRSEVFLFINCFMELVHVMVYVDRENKANEFSREATKKFLTELAISLLEKSQTYKKRPHAEVLQNSFATL